MKTSKRIFPVRAVTARGMPYYASGKLYAAACRLPCRLIFYAVYQNGHEHEQQQELITQKDGHEHDQE